MRAKHELCGLVVALGLATSLWAQGNASTFLGGFSPQQIQNVPIDTSRTVAPIAVPGAQPIQFPIISRFLSLIPRFRLSTPAHPMGSVPKPATGASTPINQSVFTPKLPFMPQQ